MIRSVQPRSDGLLTTRFGLFYCAFVVSSIGDSFRLLAVNVWIFISSDGSVLERLALVLMANLPGLLLGGISGVLSDRWNKFSVLIGADVLRVVVAVGLTICAATNSSIAALAFVAIGNAFGVFFTTSSFSLIPRLVSSNSLPRANSLMSTAQWTTQVVGPSIAAVVLVTSGPVWAFALDGLSYVVSAVCLSVLRGRQHEIGQPIGGSEAGTASSASMWASFKEGVSAIVENKQVLALISGSYGVTFLVACTNFSLIFLVANDLHLPAAALGFVYSLNGLVAVGAAVLCSAFVTSRRLGHVMWISMSGLCVAQIAMGLAPNIALLAVGIAISALANAPYNVAVTTLYQQRVPASVLGRVEGVDVMVDNAVSIFAFIVAVFGVSLFNARFVFVLSAVVIVPFVFIIARGVARTVDLKVEFDAQH